MKDNVTIEQENILYEQLTGDTKKDYFVDIFISELCFALRDERKARGISQADLAKKMGVKQPNISKIENFEKTPTIETVARYCYALGFSLEEARNLIKEMTDPRDGLYHISIKPKNVDQKRSPFVPNDRPCAVSL